jgi:hypothetical protein
VEPGWAAEGTGAGAAFADEREDARERMRESSEGMSMYPSAEAGLMSETHDIPRREASSVLWPMRSV